MYWALSGLLVDVHRHCCFCESGCCADSGSLSTAQVERHQRQTSTAAKCCAKSRTTNKFAEKGSCKWVLCRIKNAVSLTLVLDVLLLASFFTWWIMTMLQQMASTTCIDFIAEMGRKTELSGGGLTRPELICGWLVGGKTLRN